VGRVLSLATVVRYFSVETTRTTYIGANESSLHTVAACQAYRNAVATGWPGGRITWGFSWLALHTNESNYVDIRKLVAGYVQQYGDELTFLPGGYFAPMYNTPEQTNQDIHDALATISSIVGNGYRPKAIVAGFLSAKTLAYLAQVEDIHVAQGTIFSQFNIDYGDGDGGPPYPYYPSSEHYLKPAQNSSDFLDIVNLDGWTVDFLAARRNGFADNFNSRMGVGPIETLAAFGAQVGHAEQMFATAQHFDTGFALNNGEAYVTSIWEICLVDQGPPMDLLASWLNDTHARWPSAQMLTHGEFGELWRASHASNDDWNLQFVELGSGIGGSDADKETHWFVNREFRLVFLRSLTDTSLGNVIDFTRYDLPATEPTTLTRSWNLMNVLNMKGSRPQDTPRPLQQLAQADQDLIKQWYPQLFA
jgi:hypothetical protein